MTTFSALELNKYQVPAFWKQGGGGGFPSSKVKILKWNVYDLECDRPK